MDEMTQRPQAPAGPNMMGDFLKDPRNLTSALVFLAAAMNGRSQGQGLGQSIANAGVAGMGFRGGLDRGLRNQRIQDDAIQAQNLERSQNQENRQAQLGIQRQGVELQGQQLNQTERLAREQMDNAVKLKSMPDVLTPEQRRLTNAQAGYYDRMPKEGGSGSEGSLRNKMFEDLFRLQWTEEVKAASLENRPPDVLKIIPQMSNLMQGLSFVPENLQMEYGADGKLYVKIPGNPAGTPPASAVPNAEPGVVVTPEPEGVDFLAPGQAPQAPVSQRTLEQADIANARSKPKRGGPGPSSADVQEFKLTKINDDQLRAYLRDPRLKKDQAVGIREELRRRDVRRRAENSTSPGLR